MSGKTGRPWPNAPLGRVGGALGFTWIMPIGTVPLPFHPWLARLLPWTILALIGHRIVLATMGDGGGVSWWGLLLAAGALALPMLVPIVSWLAMAFRLPLLQAILIAGAMLLLAMDAATGAAPLWALALPLAWLGLFLVQRFGGSAYLRRLEAENAGFARIVPGERLVIAEGDTVAASRAVWLIKHCAVARVAVDPDLTGRSKLKPQTYFRLAPADLAAVRERVKRFKPKGWSVAGDHVLAPGIADAGDAPIRVRMVRHRAILWLVTGHRETLEVEDGGVTRRLIGGQAAIVGNWPLFTCFYWVSILGKSQWVVGFARNKPVELGPARFHDMAPRLFAPVDEGAAYAAAAPLLAELEALEAAILAEEEAMLAALLRLDPELPNGWIKLARRPDWFGRQREALCDCLQAAKAAKHAQAVRVAAELIALLPPQDYLAIGPRLLKLLNSKELAFRLLDDAARLDMPEREKLEHVRGGFSLVKNVPRLYERLAELGEAARPLIMGLGEAGRWPAPLLKAREALDGPPADN